MILVSSTSLDNVTWTPIYPPRDCASIVIENLTQVMCNLRTSASDADSEIPLIPGARREFGTGRGETRFWQNQPLFYGQLASGTGKVRVIAN